MRNPSKRMLATVGLVCLATSAQADLRQQTETAIEVYQRYCDLALSDPQAFLEATQDPASGITATAATTPDGQALFAVGMDAASGAEIEIEIGAAGRQRMISCAITSANFGADATAAAAEDFIDFVSTQNGWMVTGGPSPIAAFIGTDVPGALDAQNKSFHYYVDGMLPKSAALTRLVVGWGNFYFEAFALQKG